MIVVDNTVLTNFALVGRIDLLRVAIGGRNPCTTPAVKKEFDEGADRGLFAPTDIQWLPVVSLTPDEVSRLENLSQGFGDGEAECIVVALARGALLATDDLKTRKHVQQSGGKVTGTLGILKGLVEDGHLSIEEGDRVLRAMIEEGYFSPVDSLTRLI